MVNEERILDIIDRMRSSLPEEIRQAKRVIGEQDRLLSEAHQQVQRVFAEQGLAAAVEAERARQIEQAERDAQQVRDGADDYARQVLQELEKRLLRLTASVQSGIRELE